VSLFKTNPKAINPKAYQELAARGFNSAIRLLAFHRKETPQEALQFVAKLLKRDILQMESYKKTGLPDYYVHKFLEILEHNKISFGVHQLRPNSSMVKQADLNARTTSAGGQTRTS